MALKIWRQPLDTDKITIPRGEVHIIPERCKECGFCIEFCPCDVLEKSDVYNEHGYHPPRVKPGYESKCVCCGMCELICPDFAIYSTPIVVEKEEEKE